MTARVFVVQRPTEGMKLRIRVALICLIACFLKPFSFGQTLSQPPAAAPEETAELRPLDLVDTGLTDTNATAANTEPSEDPQGQGNGKTSGQPSGRAKPTPAAA